MGRRSVPFEADEAGLISTLISDPGHIMRESPELRLPATKSRYETVVITGLSHGNRVRFREGPAQPGI